MSAADDPHSFDLDDLEEQQGGLFAAARRRAAGQPDEPVAVTAETPRPQPRQPAPAPAKSAPKPPPTAEEPLDAAAIIQRLRARLKVVEREIKTRKALEKERAQIKRLLDAAKDRPAKVRPIRAVAR